MGTVEEKLVEFLEEEFEIEVDKKQAERIIKFINKQTIDDEDLDQEDED